MRLALAAALVLALGAPARADTAEDLAEWLPADAPVVVRIDLDAGDRMMALAERAGVPGLSGNGLLLLKLGARATIGFDPTSSDGWNRAGFDRTAPILIAVAQIDTAAATAFYDAEVDTAPAAPVWHSRLVWKARHAPGARDALRKLLNLAPGQGLNAAGTVAARLIAPGILVAARLEGDVILVDVMMSFAGGEDASALLARLPGRPAARGFRPRLGAGAARELTRPGISVWIDPARAVDSWIAFEQGMWVTAALARGGRPGGVRIDYHAACAGVRAAAAEGAFTDVAARLVPREGLTSRTVWGLRSAYGLAAQLLPEDHRLLAPEARTDAVVAGAVYLRSLSLLRALPRTDAFTGGLRPLRQAMSACGPAGRATVALVGWPQLASMMLDEIASIGPEASALADGFGNAAFAIERAAFSRDHLVGAAEVSVSDDAAAVLEHIGDLFFAGRTERPDADRPHTTWGAGPARLYRWTAAGDRAVFGVARGGRSVRWYLGEPAPEQSAPKGRLAHIIARPPRLVSQLGLSGTLATLARAFTRVEGTLTVDGELLVGTWTWTP